MAFYRLDEEDFQIAPNFVRAPSYTLLKEEKDTYTYPTEGGWIWFDTEEAAREHFGVPAEPEPEEEPGILPEAPPV